MRPRRVRRIRRPILEQLEDRTLLDANPYPNIVGPAAVFDAQTRTVTILGTEVADAVTLSADAGGSIVITHDGQLLQPILPSGLPCAQGGLCPTVKNTADITTLLCDGDDFMDVNNRNGGLSLIAIHIFGEQGNDEIETLPSNAPPVPFGEGTGSTIDGGFGNDLMRIIGSIRPEFFEIVGVQLDNPDPEIRVTDFGANVVTFQGNVDGIEEAIIEGNGGDDVFDLLTPPAADTQITLSGGGSSQSPPSHRLYRLFEPLSTGDRADGISPRGRIPGKVNINGVWGTDAVIVYGDRNPDLFEIGPGANIDQTQIVLSDLAGIAPVQIVAEEIESLAAKAADGDDVIHWLSSNLPGSEPAYDFDGGDGSDSLKVIGTEFSDGFDIRPGDLPDSLKVSITQGNNGAATDDIAARSIETLTVGARAGDDFFSIRENVPTFVVANGEEGNDAARFLPRTFSEFTTSHLHGMFTGGIGLDQAVIVTGAGDELIEVLGVQENPQRPDPLIRVTNRETNELLFELSVDTTEAITVDALGGHDQIVMREVSASLAETNWTIIAGDGNDTVDVAMAAVPAVQHVLTGEGNDDVFMRFADNPNIPPIPRDPNAALPEIMVDVGSGVDSVMIDVFGSLVTPPKDQADFVAQSDIVAQITLVEVLASIFVTGVGQLALLTLFPLGAMSMAQAIRDDRAGDTRTEATIDLAGADLAVELTTDATLDTVLIDLVPLPTSRIDIDLSTGTGFDDIAVNVGEGLPESFSLFVEQFLGQGPRKDGRVLVLFENGDRQEPVNLGALWNIDASVPPEADHQQAASMMMTFAQAGGASSFRSNLVGSPGRDEIQLDALLARNSGDIEIDLDWKTGLGDDVINVRSDVVRGRQNVQIDAGDGDNELAAYFAATQAQVDQIDQYYCAEGSWSSSDPEYDYGYDSGSGNDKVLITYAAALGLDLAISADTGDGGDSVEVVLQPIVAVRSGSICRQTSDNPNASNDGPAAAEPALSQPARFWSVALASADGADDVRLDAAFPVGPCDIVADFGIDTGAGDDRAAVRVANPSPSEGGREQEPVQEGSRRVAISLNTDSGDDQVTVNVPAVQSDGLADLIVGADGGAGPHVKAFDGGTNAEVQSFFAYAPSFSGGVRVAAGDVNGDGVADIITGAGPGAGPHVKVFDGRTNAELQSLFAFPGFTGGVFVAAGDVNGDGRDEIITGADVGAPGGHVKVFDGATGQEVRSFFAFPGFGGGVRVAAGDVNGDGFDDIVVGAGPGASGSHVKVFDGLTHKELASFFAYPQFTGGVYVAAGDVNHDGRADVITGAGASAPGGHVKVFSGADGSLLRSFFAFDPSFTGGVRVAAGDVNGDGFTDIVTGSGPGGGPHVKVFDGQSHAELRSFFAFDPNFSGGVYVAAGDLNAATQPRRFDLELAIDTAAGADAVMVNLSPTASEELHQNVRINTGPHADNVQLFYQILPFIEQDNLFSFELGAGNDVLRASIRGGSNAASDQPPPDVQLGNWVLDASGDGGHDQMVFEFSEDVHFSAGAGFSIDGGSGNDRLSLNFRGTILDDAAVDAVLAGGAGHDQVRARFDLGRGSRGKLSARVLGQAGNDQLALEILNADALIELFAVLDGGAGRDRCRTIGKVIVRNCP